MWLSRLHAADVTDVRQTQIDPDCVTPPPKGIRILVLRLFLEQHLHSGHNFDDINDINGPIPITSWKFNSRLHTALQPPFLISFSQDEHTEPLISRTTRTRDQLL